MKLLLQLADNFVAKGNTHASNIVGWCGTIEKRYKIFSSRMDKYCMQLREKLGVTNQEVSHLSIDFESEKIVLSDVEAVEEQE